MRFLIIIFLATSLFISIPKLSKVRIAYKKASENKEIAIKLYKDLASVSKKDNTVLLGYKGAASVLMARHTKKKKEKKTFFKTGALLIESAVTKKPNSIEIRWIRLSIQENSPKFLKYRKNITEDKQFIIDNYKKTSSKTVQQLIKEYVQESAIFTLKEKQLF